MASSGITVSSEELKDYSSKVIADNNKLDDTLKNIKKLMNNLQDTWKSPAGEEIRSNFNRLDAKIAEYRSIIDDYAKFLSQSADAYEQTENTLKNNASAFR